MISLEMIERAIKANFVLAKVHKKALDGYQPGVSTQRYVGDPRVVFIGVAGAFGIRDMAVREYLGISRSEFYGKKRKFRRLLDAELSGSRGNHLLTKSILVLNHIVFNSKR